MVGIVLGSEVFFRKLIEYLRGFVGLGGRRCR